MRSTIRTVAVYLLMLLLPLQGFAAAAGSRAMERCPMMNMMQDDCQHGMQHKAQRDRQAAQSSQSAPDDTQHKSSCDMGMSCPAFGAPGLASTHLFSIKHGTAILHAAIEPHDASHIPESLQRPPRQAA